MKQRDLSEMFADAGFRFFSKRDRLKNGIFPNLMYYHEVHKVGVLVVMQSQSGEDYPIARDGIRYLKAAQDKGTKVVQGYVVFATGDQANPEYVCHDTVDNTLKQLNGEPPREGRMGPYWWMTGDMTVIAQERNTRPVEAAKAPF